ncbi:MAG: DUF4139 domain-containing protein [Fimbriimonadales bacterium]|nr:DUF4139 domain-containing protein [Fimbriimonadales bacterium]
MLVPLAAATVLFSAAAPTPTGGRVVAASLFKNGYAVVVREIPVTDGKATVGEVPRAALGTLWFVPAEGAQLRSVVSSVVKTKTPAPLSSLEEVLAANVGQSVQVAFATEDPALGKAQTGRIVSAEGQLLVLRTAAGTVALPKAAIRSVVAAGGALKWQREVETRKRVVRIETTGAGSGKVLMVSLERGLLWAPSYALDASDPKRLRILCKATLVNDLTDLKQADLRLVTGFPNVPFAPTGEPFSTGAGIEPTLAALVRAGAPDEARREGALLTQNMAAAPGGLAFDAAFPPAPQIPGEQLEDLFFYRLSGLRLAKGDRAIAYVFAVESEYEHLHTWDVADGSLLRPGAEGPSDEPGEVWNCLRFHNRSGQPWTTAPVTVTKDGQILGQDTLRYTGRDAEALVRVTKALDVRARATEEELSRERGAVRNSAGSPVFDLVTLKGTLTARNAKPEPIRLRIRKELTGEVESAEGNPSVTKSARGLREANPVSRLEWNATLQPGETLERTYTYKVYVPSRG